MDYNALISVEVIDDVTAEPVTLSEVKQHLNMQFDTEGSYEFTDDDQYLTDLITQAREAIERVTWYNLAPKNMRATINNSLGGFDLPYGPVTGDPVVTDEDGEEVEAKLRGGIVVTCGEYQVVEYTGGYTNIPVSLKRALLEEIAWLYNHRGEENNLTEQNRRLAKLHKKKTWLL